MSFSIALTGGIGSGKSTISNAFAKLGINIIDADVIAREIIDDPNSEILNQIIQHYGESILTKEGRLHRAQLRKIIFQQPKEKYWLEQLLHPLINIRIQKLKKLSLSPYTILVIPLLIEKKLQYLADRILVVDVEQSTQLLRTQQRDNISINQVKKIIFTQTSRCQRLLIANDIINNNGPLENSLKYVNKLHFKYLYLSLIKYI